MKTKICTKCRCEKLLSEFSKDKNRKDNRHPYCKLCQSQYHKNRKDDRKFYNDKNRIKLAFQQRNYIKRNPWMTSYTSAKQRCTNPKNEKYHRYGGRDIKFLLTIDEIKHLWFRDKAYNLKKASIDREDNDGDYILQNCHFIEHSINSQKDQDMRVIKQFNLQGKFIREWESISEAGRQLFTSPANIVGVLKGYQKTAKGFKWEYKNE
jgi:hypothetical protein